MRVLKMVLVVSSLAGMAACGNDAPSRSLDRDLAWLDSLSAQPQAAQAAVVSPLEMNALAAPAGGVKSVEEVKLAAKSVKPSVQTTEKPNTGETRARSSSPSRSRAASASRRSSSRGSGTYASAPARQPRIVTKKNTARDAAIGAGAGAVIGAVAGGSRHRVRGAVVGAVVGGAAGAVIGSTVDVQRRVEH